MAIVTVTSQCTNEDSACGSGASCTEYIVLELGSHSSFRPVFIFLLTLLEQLTPTFLSFGIFRVETSLLLTSHYMIHLFNLLSQRLKTTKFLSLFFLQMWHFSNDCVASEYPESPAHKELGECRKSHLTLLQLYCHSAKKKTVPSLPQLRTAPAHRIPEWVTLTRPCCWDLGMHGFFLRLFPQRKQLVNFSYPPSSGQCWYKHFLGI